MKFVGEGSSGCFYATDLRGFGIVRVKLLKPDARADAWELAALRKEVAWMASMRRNIVQVYAMVISTEGAVVGLVAEYFSSGPLSSVLRQQVRVAGFLQTSVPTALPCSLQNTVCCGGLMQSLRAGSALMT
jgi:hypothetical protein